MGFARILLKISGWKVSTDVKVPDKCIIAIAPHSSAMDFVWGKLALTYLGHSSWFLIKKEFFVFPLGYLLKWMGAIPVERGKYGSKMVKSAVEVFRKRKIFKLVITVEGTRKKTRHWKKGFWVIAHEANVPVVYGYVDYKKREMKLTGILDLTDSWDNDIAVLKSKYNGVTARYPDCFTNE
jgi:1-acyl-sn-glycerol-3-phosphate acyltransferase